MIRERPTQRRFLSFRFLTMLFLLLLVGALAPGELITTAELPFGLSPSDEQSPSAPSAITISARDLPATQRTALQDQCLPAEAFRIASSL